MHLFHTNCCHQLTVPVSKKITLAEIESSLCKAARAVRLDWGIAEEMGKSARWLAAFNLPGPALALQYLQSINGKQYAGLIPDCSRPVWQADSGLLCPVISGAALADRSAKMLRGQTFELLNVAFPLLLAATVGQAARCHQTLVTVSWAQVRVHCYENGLSIQGHHGDLFLHQVDSVVRQQGDQQTAAETPQQLPSTLAYSIDPDTWAMINVLAFKTYVPASEASRAGAGAGLVDND